MPPKAKITRDMVVCAAFEIARRSGAEQINARTVAQTLGCSTQPVMYHFAKIEGLKRAVYEKLDQYHTQYLIRTPAPQQETPLSIGLNDIRFAVEEPHLFRFLFQSGFALENSLLEMMDSQGLQPVISAMQRAADLSLEQAKQVFFTVALFTHGYASILANNAFPYDEKAAAFHLKRAYCGAVSAVQEEIK